MSCSSSEAAAENIVSMVNDAVNGGACLLAGDMKHDGPWVQPHVVLGAKPGDRLWDRESFGPGTCCSVKKNLHHHSSPLDLQCWLLRWWTR